MTASLLASLPQRLGSFAIGREEFLVELYPETGFFAEYHMALLDHRLVAEQSIVPGRVTVAMEFQSEKIGYAGADMGVGHGAQGTAVVVWRKGDVIDLGQVGDLAAFRQPTALGDVGHDDVDRLLGQQVTEAIAQV